jgi:integrase
MATIRQRKQADGTTSYHVQVRLKGHRPETASFRRLTDARKWAQATEAAIREGRHFPTSAARQRTLEDLIDRYTQTVLPHKKRGSIAVQRPRLRWWREQIGPLRLADVTPAVLAEQRDILSQRLAPGTVEQYLLAVSHAFTVAVREWQWLTSNPVHNVSKPRKPKGRIRYLDDGERERLLAACKASDATWLHPLVVLALSTGCRKMELLRLCWTDVDLQRVTITLHDTKNSEPRTVPLVGPALTLMHEHAKVRCIDSALVFPARNGMRPVNIERVWTTARQQAKLKDFRFHDLRHSTGSYLAMSGASPRDIMEILGHRDIKTSMRYVHLSQQHTAGVVARMNAAIFAQP